MENDEFVEPSRVPIIVLISMLIFLLAGVSLTGVIQVYKEVSRSNERITMACLDKLTDKDSPYYASQLKACLKEE